MADSELELILKLGDELSPKLKEIMNTMKAASKSRDMKETESGFEKIGKSAVKAGEQIKSNFISPTLSKFGIGVGIAGVTAAVAAAISKLSEAGKAYQQATIMSERTGIPKRTVSDFKMAADVFGVSAEQMNAAMANVSEVSRSMHGGAMNQIAGKALELRKALTERPGNTGKAMWADIQKFIEANPGDNAGLVIKMFETAQQAGPQFHAMVLDLMNLPSQIDPKRFLEVYKEFSKRPKFWEDAEAKSIEIAKQSAIIKKHWEELSDHTLWTFSKPIQATLEAFNETLSNIDKTFRGKPDEKGEQSWAYKNLFAPPTEREKAILFGAPKEPPGETTEPATTVRDPMAVPKPILAPRMTPPRMSLPIRLPPLSVDVERVVKAMRQEGADEKLPVTNPGGLRYDDFARERGATGADDKGRAIFPDYDAGRKALERLITEAGSLSEIARRTDRPPEFATGLGRATRLKPDVPIREQTDLDELRKRFVPPQSNIELRERAAQARKADMPLPDLTIGGLDPELRARIAEAGRTMAKEGIDLAVLEGYRHKPTFRERAGGRGTPFGEGREAVVNQQAQDWIAQHPEMGLRTGGPEVRTGREPQANVDRLSDALRGPALTRSIMRSEGVATPMKVEGDATLTVDVSAPRGTKIGLAARGMFRKTKIVRSSMMGGAERDGEATVPISQNDE